MGVYLFGGDVVAGSLLDVLVELLCVVRKEVLDEEVFLVVGDFLASVGVGFEFALLQCDTDVESFFGVCRPDSYHYGAASVALRFSVFNA